MERCEQCGGTDEVVRRMGPKPDGVWPVPVNGGKVRDPLLCRTCCGQAPWRGWMVGRDERPAPAFVPKTTAPSRAARSGRR